MAAAAQSSADTSANLSPWCVDLVSRPVPDFSLARWETKRRDQLREAADLLAEADETVSRTTALERSTSVAISQKLQSSSPDGWQTVLPPSRDVAAESLNDLDRRRRRQDAKLKNVWSAREETALQRALYTHKRLT
eukprot:TRINITY_DN58851_c0_g1_i1.p1 TRINITY_DN58851_c0_g1~~TRINITY_DN58851_c0_g1_i1.p1  ORF type:complete len:136 (-),score=16.54 TRINITY_DN58851_c0_g1_i1:70-477(-)